MLRTRRVTWVEAARRDFDDFPEGARRICIHALTILADGGVPAIVKPLKGLGSGVMQIGIRYGGDAFRVVVDVKAASDLWVLHAFQKKSHKGVATPAHEIDLMRRRLRQVRSMRR